MGNTELATISQSLASTEQLAASLLADKSKLGTTDARFYLASRLRTRTSAGAVEYLKVLSTHQPQGWDARVKLSLDLMEIYRELFAEPYRASCSPPYSTAREHELYRLVNQFCFPLCIAEDRKTILIEKLIEEDPNFILPVIPVAGTQQHDWINGCCPFQDIQTIFKLVLVLANHQTSRKHRESFLNTYGFDSSMVAPPLGAYSWTHFEYWCATSGGGGTWLGYLPLAFKMVAYKTGSPWLDIPPNSGDVGFPWTPKNIALLLQARRRAEEINQQVSALNHWLDVTGRVGVTLAIQIWNDAANMEAEDGFAGVAAEDLRERLEQIIRQRVELWNN
jgi:hypothetical protein